MKVFIGADHRGYELKEQIKDLLGRLGHEAVDKGTHQPGEPCDYPELAFAVAREVAATEGTRGMLICMTGIGHVIAANKVKGAYAALCYNTEAARLSREHNNANILVLGAKFVTPGQMEEIISTWLATDFEGGRHERRVGQIRAFEEEMLK